MNGDTALFNDGGAANGSPILGNSSQPINTILFDSITNAAYTLGDSFSSDTFNFDAGGAITVNGTVTPTQTIFAAILANGALTIKNSSTTGALTLDGNISGTGASISYGGATGGVIQINGQNTYSGTTTININGNTLQIGSSSNSGLFTSGPFGTSTILTSSSTNSPLQAIGADRVVANPFTLTFGFTVSNAATPHNLAFSGPMSYTSASSRTLTINTPGQTTTLGDAASPSTITLSSIASVPLIMDTSQDSTLVINDVIQDNGATTGLVSYNSIGNNTPEGTMHINSANTYSRATAFGNQTSGTFNALTVQLNVSSVGSPGSITSGPFGKGTITFSNTNAPAVLEPFGADRTIANAITLNAGLFAANPPVALDPTGPHILTLSGPITLGSTSRTITNNMVGNSVLIFGAGPPSTSTISLGNTLTFQTQVAVSGPGGGLTTVNDAVSGTGGITVQNGATVILNNANSYAGTTTVQIGTGGSGIPTLLVNNSSGSGTGTGLVNVKTGTLGGVGVIVPTATPTVSIPAQVFVGSAGTLAPGAGGVGTLTLDSSSAAGPLLTLAAGATISEDLNASFLSDKTAVIHAAANDVTFNGNIINFTDLTGGTLASGSYPIITADAAGAYSGLTVDGSNNITSGLSIGSGLSGYSTAVLQQIGNNIVLTIPGPALFGDYNDNGIVDAADYVVWRKGLGTTYTQSDYDVWRSHFGQTAGSGAGASSNATVPEPATLVLLMFAAAGWCLRRGRAE